MCCGSTGATAYPTPRPSKAQPTTCPVAFSTASVWCSAGAVRTTERVVRVCAWAARSQKCVSPSDERVARVRARLRDAGSAELEQKWLSCFRNGHVTDSASRRLVRGREKSGGPVIWFGFTLLNEFYSSKSCNGTSQDIAVSPVGSDVFSRHRSRARARLVRAWLWCRPHRRVTHES